jgi:hypothetical protein
MDSKLCRDFENFLQEKYSFLTVHKVVELQDYIRFIVVDEGDFEGLSEFISLVRGIFNGKVELRRESTKSFQLEILLPKPPATPPSPQTRTSLWILPMLALVFTSTMSAVLIWLSKPS